MEPFGERLEKLRAKYSNLRPDVSEKMERHIAELRSDGSVDRALKPGELAPTFVLVDQRGKWIYSAELLARGPLIVSLYRGTWCPYCNEEISAPANAYESIRSVGAELVAITPESTENARGFRESNPVPFSILVDANNDVAAGFGLRYAIVSQ